MTMASVKVAVRVRPFNQRELDMQAKLIVQMDGKKTTLNAVKNSKEPSDGAREKHKDFTFDYSYWSYDHRDNNYASQEQVFSDLGVDVIESAFEGYNACVFAYGQTGSGKTFTMMGAPDNQGLIPRICRQLFARMAAGKETGASYRTEVSYLEIYNEKVKDLLGGESSHSLRVREHPRLGPYVQDLSKHLVSDYDDIQECMHRGNAQRTTAATAMNDVSSRSHAIFTVTFVQARYLPHSNLPSETESKVHLVDLAGSERADATGASGQRLVEGAHINKSLVTLGSVISALAEASNNKLIKGASKKQVFIPYRDSVLTWLLKDSLGGNSKTIMIAAISPADCNYGETLSTLRYANRAKNIINKPTINEDPNVKLIRELREEIDKLRAQITHNTSPVDPESNVLATLQRKEAQEKVLTEKWTEKWRETQQILQEQKALGLRKSGLGVVLDSDMPHLVGIDDNLLSTGVTLYHLKEGETVIGSSSLVPTPDIVIAGAGVLPRHCSILRAAGEAVLAPAPGAHCWLNTVLVHAPTKLSQGCIILLGRTNMFRYNDPAEAAKLRQEGAAHMNLSRLSLLSWSTTELHASADSLHASTTDLQSEAVNDRLTSRSELERSRKQSQLKQQEREESWKAEREQLLQAQRQLDEERAASSSPRTTSPGWSLRRRALTARQLELRRRIHTLPAVTTLTQQAETEEVRVAELQATVDAKTADLEEFVRASLRGLVARGCRIDESEPSSPCSATSESSTECLMRLLQQCPSATTDNIKDTVERHKKEIVELEEELQTRMATVSLHRANIERVQGELQRLAAQQAAVQRAVSSTEEDSDVSSTESIKRSKSELVLRSTTREALDLPPTEELGSYRALKIHLSLSLDPLPAPLTSPSPTFHTASSGSPAPPAAPLATPLTTNTAEDSATDLTPQFKLGPSVDDSDDLSSTEEYHKPRIIEGQSSSSVDRSPDDRQRIRHRRRISDKPGRRQVTEAEALRALGRLCSRIAAHKLLVIASLENDCSKEELNHQIAVLQDLQKKYVRLEMALQYSFFDNGNTRRNMMVTPIQETPSLTLSESDMQVTTDNGNSREQTADDPLIHRLKEHDLEGSDNVSTSNDELHDTWEHPLRHNHVQHNNVVQHGNNQEYYEPDVVATIDPSPGLQYPVDFSTVISIPGWVTRGAGAGTHHEFEVRVSVGEERWLLLRRYRRFRDLRQDMNRQYGDQVSSIPFPPRQLWSSESVARSRRAALERFLRRLLAAAAAHPAAPLHRRPLTRDLLVALHPFFRKGVFESGKCGTG